MRVTFRVLEGAHLTRLGRHGLLTNVPDLERVWQAHPGVEVFLVSALAVNAVLAVLCASADVDVAAPLEQLRSGPCGLRLAVVNLLRLRWSGGCGGGNSRCFHFYSSSGAYTPCCRTSVVVLAARLRRVGLPRRVLTCGVL